LLTASGARNRKRKASLEDSPLLPEAPDIKESSERRSPGESREKTVEMGEELNVWVDRDGFPPNQFPVSPQTQNAAVSVRVFLSTLDQKSHVPLTWIHFRFFKRLNWTERVD